MKKVIPTLIMLASTAVQAEGFYGGLSANSFNAVIYENVRVEGSSWGGELGYAFNPYIAVEFRAAPPWMQTNLHGGNGLKLELDGFNYGGVIIPTYPITDKISLYGVAGVNVQEIKLQYFEYTDRGKHIDGMYGAGIQYNHGDNYIRTEASRNYDGDMRGVSLGLGLRF